MALRVEIDPNAGFCGGVIAAISKAEAYLDAHPGVKLHSLGAIVHNEEELERLSEKGLEPVGLEDIEKLPSGSELLIRAHGEPPSTYSRVEGRRIRIIDCTCPVVLKLQKDIREAMSRMRASGGTLVIFGKRGHAEVLGLVGQTDGEAVVVEDEGMLLEALNSGMIDRNCPVEIFSQTTKSPAEFSMICSALKREMKENVPCLVHDTICRQVAARHSGLAAFAASHDVVIFVSGDQSSNGKVLFDLCRSVNARTYKVSKSSQIRRNWLNGASNIGVSGATSTPRWLLEDVAESLRNE